VQIADRILGAADGAWNRLLSRTVTTIGCWRQHFIAATALSGTSADCIAGPRVVGAAEAARAAFSADGVFDAFITHRLVALGIHLPRESHDAVGALPADPRPPDVVDDTVVEFGSVTCGCVQGAGVIRW